MGNPLLHRFNDGKSAGIVNKDRIADDTIHMKQGFNTFDLSQHTFATYKYGEIMPFFNLEAVPGDHLSIRNQHNVNTYTLASPLLSTVRMNTDYFAVPMQSIMPFTWDLLVVDPKKGSDLPDGALPKWDINGFWKTIVDKLVAADGSNDLNLKLTLLLIKVFSGSGLLENLNFHSQYSREVDNALSVASATLTGSINLSYKDFVDGAVVQKSKKFSFQSPELSKKRRAFLDMLYFDEAWISAIDPNTTEQIESFVAAFVNELTSPVTSTEPNYINLSKVIAYQQICTQFYTNDNVDYVFTAKDYMDILMNQVISFAAESFRHFTYNGLDRTYDCISNVILTKATNQLVAPAFVSEAYYFFSNIFDVRRSLKYGDYFLSARVRPLAVGDVSIGVDSDTMTVNAVDVTRNIAIQRFLNAVNRAGNVIQSYMTNIFGEAPSVVEPQPNFIGHSVDIVGKSGTTNTSDKQGQITVNMNANGSDYAFDVKIKGEYCIILGLVSFDCEFAYGTTCQRDFRHFDRFDYFNPMLQSIGDQAISLGELRDGTENDRIFGYDQRYGEYKRAYNYACGGFLSKTSNGDYAAGLSTWLNIPKNQSAEATDVFLNPTFIRSNPQDFDKFYKSLTGDNIRDYYHFIADFHNIVKANRKMEYQPGILEG